METPTEPPDGAAARRLSSRMAILMLGVVGGTCLILDAMANSQAVQDWMRRVSWQQSKLKKQIPLFCYNEHFSDYEDCLLHKVVPAADFSRGGVYFMGASNMKWALKLWDLPAETRPLIRNFAFGGTKHSSQFEFIRFLVEQEGFLKAGGEKTLVVFGVNYRNAHHSKRNRAGRDEYFDSLWNRHGFYTIAADGSIHRSGLNAVAETMILERIKITGLLKELVNLAYVPFKPTRVQDRNAYNQYWAAGMGPHWEEMVGSEAAAFGRMVDYLQQRNVKVVAVRMPVGSWEDDLPYERAYIRQLREVCESRGVRIHDFSRMLDDDLFADSIHLTPAGIEKFEPAVMKIALEHLRSTGALPEKSVEPIP
jgi:hypothetical protein